MTEQEVQQRLDTIYWEIKKLRDECPVHLQVWIEADAREAGRKLLRARNRVRGYIAFKKAEAEGISSTFWGLRS